MLHLRSEEAGPLLGFLRALCGIAFACAPALLGGVVVAALLALPMRLLRWDALLLVLVLLGPLPAVLFGTLLMLFALPLRRTAAIRPSVLAGLLATVRQQAPPLLLLLLVAAGLEVSSSALPAGLWSQLTLSLALLFAARLDQAGAVAVAAVLVRKGFDPGLAIGLVALGPMSRGVLESLRGTARGGGALRLSLFAALALGAAPLSSGLLLAAHPSADRAFALVRGPVFAQLAASPLGGASAAVLVALALATLWQAGVRGWFSPLRHGAAA